MENTNNVILSGNLLYIAGGLLTFIGILAVYIWKERNMYINCELAENRKSIETVRKENREEHCKIYDEIGKKADKK